MRVPALPTIASFVLLALPGFAQTSNQSSNMSGGQPGDTSTSSHVPPDTAVTLDTAKAEAIARAERFQEGARPARSVRHSRPGPGRLENCHGSEPRSDAGDH